MEVYAPMIKHMLLASKIQTGSQKSQISGKAFQILGFDLLFDVTGKAWLLEINDNPSLDVFHTTDYMGGGGPKILSKVDLEVKMLAVG